MQNLIDMAIVKAIKELPHVALVTYQTSDHDQHLLPTNNHHTHTDGFYLHLWYGESHPRPVCQPCQVMVHVIEDHVNASLVQVTLDYIHTTT
jgi:hypothetical protein